MGDIFILAILAVLVILNIRMVLLFVYSKIAYKRTKDKIQNAATEREIAQATGEFIEIDSFFVALDLTKWEYKDFYPRL